MTSTNILKKIKILLEGFSDHFLLLYANPELDEKIFDYEVRDGEFKKETRDFGKDIIGNKKDKLPDLQKLKKARIKAHLPGVEAKRRNSNRIRDRKMSVVNDND